MIRIGILGAARIAPRGIVTPANALLGAEVVAIGARDLERARNFAAQHSIPLALGSYAELVARDDIDLIYVALPPSAHLEWCVKALANGKHVLVEKPFASNAQHAAEMVAAARASGRHLIEAFHYRFHPLFESALTSLRAGAIGKIRHIEAVFNANLPDTPGELRYIEALGGGALMDLGCYCMHWIRTVAGDEPTIVSARARCGAPGVDLETEAELAFTSGPTATLKCSMQPEDGVLFRRLRVQGDAGPRDLVAVGITNQRETTVLWERASGAPLARAIVWQDRRTAAHCDRLRAAGLEPQIAARTGLLLDPYFSATKMAWLLENIPGARQRAERGELCFGTIDSWLVFNLTAGRRHVTDATNASRTMLFDLGTGGWSDRLLEIFGIPRAALPQIVDTCLDPDAAIRIELDGVELPLAGIAGDQQAALFGQACFEPGMAKNTYGTGCFALMNSGTVPRVSRHRLLTTVAWRRGGCHFALEGGVFMGGATVQWLRDGLGMIQRSDDVEALAASVPDTGDVYLVPAFAGLGAPQWDAAARGMLIGLTRGTQRAHIARAALESIAFQTADLVDAMREDAGHPLAELRVDGGAARNDLLLQFQADLLGVPVLRPTNTETTAFGAAALAGLGTGFWQSQSELASLWSLDKRFEPRMDRADAATRRARWNEALSRSRGWAKS
jgi:glycerol kinase